MNVFDKVIQQAVVWLKEMMAELRTDDPHKALHAMRAGLHALRDRLTVDEAAQLSAQLPQLVRGLFFEGWDPSHKPVRVRHREDFLEMVRREYSPRSDLEMSDIVSALFRVMIRHVSPGEMADVLQSLPHGIHELAQPPAPPAP